MIDRVCDTIHNYFTRKDNRELARWHGEFTIEDGALTIEGLKNGNYFLIRGSDYNDGVHQYPADDMTDETFTGTIFKMAPPKSFLALVDEISAWDEKYSAAVNSPYSSESFNGYSYVKAGTDNRSGSTTPTWQSTFSARLDAWRKLYEHL